MAATDMPGDQRRPDDRPCGKASQAGPICVIAEHGSHRRSLVTLLRAFGIAVLSFPTAGSCFRYLQSSRESAPRCAIIDLYRLNQPLSDCIAQLQKLTDRPPVLLLTGFVRFTGQRHPPVDAAEAAILVKPYDPDTLLAKLSCLLNVDVPL